VSSAFGTSHSAVSKYSYDVGMVTGEINVKPWSSATDMGGVKCKAVKNAFDFDPNGGSVHIKLTGYTPDHTKGTAFVRRYPADATQATNDWNSFQICYEKAPPPGAEWTDAVADDPKNVVGYMAWQGFTSQGRLTTQDVFHDLNANTSALYNQTFTENLEIPFHGAEGGTCVPELWGGVFSCCPIINLPFDVVPTIVATFDGDDSTATDKNSDVFVQSVNKNVYTTIDAPTDRYSSIDVRFCLKKDSVAGNISYFAFRDQQSNNYVYFPEPADKVTIAQHPLHGITNNTIHNDTNYNNSNSHRPLMQPLENGTTFTDSAHRNGNQLNPYQTGFVRSGILQLDTGTDCHAVAHDSSKLAFATSIEPLNDAPCPVWVDHKMGQTHMCNLPLSTCGSEEDKYSYFVVSSQKAITAGAI